MVSAIDQLLNCKETLIMMRIVAPNSMKEHYTTVLVDIQNMIFDIENEKNNLHNLK